MRRLFSVLFAFLAPIWAAAHEFEADRITVFDATAAVLDGDTSTLFVSMSIMNGSATTDLVGFETNRGTVGDWIEVRRAFGREQVKVLEKKTIRTGTIYDLQQPDAYLVIEDVDPSVYTADFGYILIHVLFEDGTGLDVAVWIDPIYVQVGN